MRLSHFSALLCLLATSACSSAGPEAPVSSSAHQPGSPAAIAAATVAQQTGGRTDEVTIHSIQPVDFSDSSLGCPQPGMAYLQVITPGYKVLAEYAGKNFDVHVAGGRGVICDPRAAHEAEKH